MEEFSVRSNDYVTTSDVGLNVFDFEPPKPKFCDCCGKNMQGPNGSQTIGLMIILTSHNQSEEQNRFMQFQMGPYKINKHYGFCWECWLINMGAKP